MENAGCTCLKNHAQIAIAEYHAAPAEGPGDGEFEERVKESIKGLDGKAARNRDDV